MGLGRDRTTRRWWCRCRGRVRPLPICPIFADPQSLQSPLSDQKGHPLPAFKHDPSLHDRAAEAAKAKQAQLARLAKARAEAATADPAVKAAKAAATDAWLERKEAASLARREQIAADTAARRAKAEQKAAEEAIDTEAVKAELLAKQKAARDARYAARKARK